MSTVFQGPAATQLFRWLSVRMQLKLEQKGLRSSGGPLRPRLAPQLGLKSCDSYEAFHAAVNAKIAEAEGQVPAGAIRVLK